MPSNFFSILALLKAYFNIYLWRIYVAIWESQRLVLAVHDLAADSADNRRIHMMTHWNLSGENSHVLVACGTVDIASNRFRMSM